MTAFHVTGAATAASTIQYVVSTDIVTTGTAPFFPERPWWVAFEHIRNPDIGILRAWVQDDLGWSRQRLRRTPISGLRRAWRLWAWNEPQPPQKGFLARILDSWKPY